MPSGPSSDRPDKADGAVARWLVLNTAPTNTRYIKRSVEYAWKDHFFADVSRDLLTRYHLRLEQQRVQRDTYNRTMKTVGDTHKPLSEWTIQHYVSAASSVLRWASDARNALKSIARRKDLLDDAGGCNKAADRTHEGALRVDRRAHAG